VRSWVQVPSPRLDSTSRLEKSLKALYNGLISGFVRIPFLITGAFVNILQSISLRISKLEISQYLLIFVPKFDRTGRTIKRNFSPDSYFKMQKDEAILGYFLEYDTGNMDKEQLTRKFMRYFEYFVYGDWPKRFTVFPSILFLTNRTDEQINNLLEKDEVELDKALKDRTYLAKSKHVILKGIGISENIRTISSDKIREFLRIEIIFAHTNKNWSKQLMNKLSLS
jgi:hypothetical protein